MSSARHRIREEGVHTHNVKCCSRAGRNESRGKATGINSYISDDLWGNCFLQRVNAESRLQQAGE